MPQISLPDGTVIAAPDNLDREQLRAWVTQRVRDREELQPGNPRFERIMEEGKDRGAAEAAPLIPSMLASAAIGPGGPLRAMGTIGRVLTHPVTVGVGTAGVRAAGGTPVPRAIGEGFLASLFAGPRVARVGRKWDELMKRSAERLGRSPLRSVEGAMEVPGRTLTKASAPPFLPKGKMRLDLGPTEQTTLTGTVGTSRPPLPKPVQSSTGAVPKGRVSQPNVSVRTEAAREAVAPPAGPAAKTSSYGGPLEADLKASIAREQGRPFRRRSGLRQQPGQEPWRPLQETQRRTDEFTDEITSRIRELAREGRSRAAIAKKLSEEFGATPGQSAIAMDAVLKRSRQ